ncbi:type II toxin-antitoxin system RelE/ParE family toxin (plasmid) [Rhizobium sp. TRM96647]|uniref:type II toxin-antitoxin system RelE/ParE family toxin n=1 Tax=unclassified Rhizobium TaxID=2613769 RepID=UPI0021E8FC1D|nr:MULTISPECIES: type II toxin-antitoxin system RelE/ParE family toxin [unclassified Rhizobium]MCV3735574.1 type II toxin-antitoxin system RelE/ParE family toxin [Rhizobium sp. TRM96647]MCV3757663.1 type II toxin-antitoxin system RelE/ParE family toxin [Rhizobium sp. TRM96650]
MKYRLRYTEEALEDFDRLYDFLIAYDVALAERASSAIQSALAMLTEFPFSCRKAQGDPLLRELLVPFGSSGYVVLFRIEDARTVTIAAVRHQREDDYH